MSYRRLITVDEDDVVALEAVADVLRAALVCEPCGIVVVNAAAHDRHHAELRNVSASVSSARRTRLY